MIKRLRTIFIALFLFFLSAYVFLMIRDYYAEPLPDVSIPDTPIIEQEIPSPAPTPTTPPEDKVEDIEEDLPDDGLPHDKLFITVERQKYKDSDLILKIPKLDKEWPVLSGVTDDVLAKGVGLYDYAQLPGKGNRNVSVAGHRNGRTNGKVTDRAPFYYIDTLKEGDYLYLRDANNIYRYVYHSTDIVEEDDWGPIYSQGFSCLTLTSCHPIGISNQRIIVRGKLDEIFPYDKDFDYLSHTEEATQ